VVIDDQHGAARQHIVLLFFPETAGRRLEEIAPEA
jgi:hypothetical protein